MKDADKNRDPERARKRAVTDARCALRKLGLMCKLEALLEQWNNVGEDELAEFVLDLCDELGIEVGDE